MTAMLKIVDGIAVEMLPDEVAAFEATRTPAGGAVTPEVFGAAIQCHLDATARSRGYDSALSIATYVGSSIPHWAAEATAFFAWRDAVWAYAYAELAKVRADEREQPSVAGLIEELPAITWPG